MNVVVLCSWFSLFGDQIVCILFLCCGGMIQMVKGWYFNLLDFESSEWDVEVVVVVLLKLCCFIGYCILFYFVVQYVVLVSYVVLLEYVYEVLYYDDGEVFINDIVKLLKELLLDYQCFEVWIQVVVFNQFGLFVELLDCVKEVDLVFLVIEQCDLMLCNFYGDYMFWWIVCCIRFLVICIEFWIFDYVECVFLVCYYELFVLCSVYQFLV